MLRPFRSLLPCLLAASLTAQEQLVVVGPEPAMVRVGDSARVELQIREPGGDARRPNLPTVDGLRFRLLGPTQHMEQRFDGQRMVRRSTVSWVLEIQPAREGVFTVPPFAVWTGKGEQQTRELRLESKRDLRGEELGYLDVQLESTRVYVHEPIRIRVDCGVHEDLRLVTGRANNGQPYTDLEVQASWLADFPGGEPIEVGKPPGGLALIVQGGNNLMIASADEGVERAGKRWRRFRFERAFLPTQIGRIELPAPMLRFHVVLREGQQDLFGLRRGGVTENYYKIGQPLVLDVLPIPEVGRPTPFWGAVGRFELAAALDRDSVKLGGSVKLTLTVKGRGNLEFLRLPTLDALAGFHKLGQTEAKRDGEQVAITYDLAPLSADVREVPAIGWNYFDTTPGVERFAEVATKPLPLLVQPLPPGETLAPLKDSAPKAVTPGVDDIFDLPTFDGGPVVINSVPRWLPWLAVLLPWLLCFGWRAFRRSRAAAAADVVGQQSRRAARACEQALAAGAEPLTAFSDYLGARLGVPGPAVIAPDLPQRLAGAKMDDTVARDVAAAVEQGTAGRYGGGQALTAAAVTALVQRLERLRFGVRALWLLPFLLTSLAQAPLPAQAQGPAEVGVAAYRAGDYVAAESAFAAAFAATGDRRFQRARGNCLVRSNDLPRALQAYESARLGLPRDDELAANLRLVRARLELDDGPAGFAAEVGAFLRRFTASERAFACGLLMLAAAACLLFGWSRIGLRWLGLLCLVPAAWLALELLWLAPQRPQPAIARQKLSLVSEPRADLPPLLTVRPGVTVELLGSAQGAYVRVRVGERVGYAAVQDLLPIE
jgi:tetratricopeptide (TPR) repeat protein